MPGTRTSMPYTELPSTTDLIYSLGGCRLSSNVHCPGGFGSGSCASRIPAASALISPNRTFRDVRACSNMPLRTSISQSGTCHLAAARSRSRALPTCNMAAMSTESRPPRESGPLARLLEIQIAFTDIAPERDRLCAILCRITLLGESDTRVGVAERSERLT